VFTAAYFDYYGRYCYGNQPSICRLNLEMLQQPLGMVIPVADMEAGLAAYEEQYYQTYRQLMLNKLGFEQVNESQGNELLKRTIELLKETQVGYHAFFTELTQQFHPSWRDDVSQIFAQVSFCQSAEQQVLLANWRELYHHILQDLSTDELAKMADRLQDKNPKTALLRPVIEEVWAAIDRDDNWQPFDELVRRLQEKK
jgi:uncharacterized protein YdiU (UPF0061 family)